MDGKIEKTEFLEKFMPSIGDYIARGYKLTGKQETVLNSYLNVVKELVKNDDMHSIKSLNEQAKNIDVKNYFRELYARKVKEIVGDNEIDDDLYYSICQQVYEEVF
ncbi:hypothetical protein [Sphingobacterium daejeonense]|uniref:hypothetical protein n=1 Tax=Sphingobacterium daejeonense TaxID=371142 RepID=UPI0010FD1025|nr:hypothetical protein [Sphingobacterium daejeonense]